MLNGTPRFMRLTLLLTRSETDIIIFILTLYFYVNSTEAFINSNYRAFSVRITYLTIAINNFQLITLITADTYIQALAISSLNQAP